MRLWRIGARSALAVSLAFGGIGAVSVAGQAEPQTPGQVLQAGVRKMQTGHKLPGVIGMVRNGDAAAYAHAGESDMFAHVPADPRAPFRIGSNTKQFTSTVLLQLEAEGKLSLDETVDKWLPGVVNKNGNDGKNITIRALLNHSSRIPDFINAATKYAYMADVNPDQPHDPRQLVDQALEQKPLSEPGYSNTNYVLAGLIIKAVTGNDAATEVRDRIIDRLGLTHTTFPTDDSKLPAGFLHGYEWIRDISFSNTPQLFGPAGAMVSTLDDLAEFDRALFSGRLLPPAQLRELETVGDLPTYALGVGRVDTPDCGTVYTFTGEVLGYSNTWITSPDGQRQAVVARNEYHVDPNDPAGTTEYNTALAAYCATGQ